MRKVVWLALATGALVLLQRRAARLGFVPGLLLATAAEKALAHLQPPPPPPKPSVWRRLFPTRPQPSPAKEPAQS